MFLNANVGPVHPYGNPRTFVRPTQGGDQSILQFLKGKMGKIKQGVLTMLIERIPIIMQEFVVGILMTWIRLLRRVNRDVIHYREAEEDMEQTYIYSHIYGF